MNAPPPATAGPELPWPVLLYDGTCGFCDATVQLLLRHDRRRTLRFAPLESAFGRSALAAHPGLAGVDSVIWLEPGRRPHALTKSDAGLRAARYLGGPWRLAVLGRLVPRVLRDRVYDLVARHRHHILGRTERCVIPAPEHRHRFLDSATAPIQPTD